MTKSAPQLLVFMTALTPQLEVELQRRRVIEAKDLGSHSKVMEGFPDP